MNLIRDYWDKDSYHEFLTYLYSQQDKTYQLFHAKLLKNNTIKNIGVRTPLLKTIAKQISKGNYLSFIENISYEYYEEKVIYGFILGYIKTTFDTRIKLIEEFIPYIDNWATNDLVCANLIFFKKEQARGLYFINKWLNSSNTWMVRFAIVLLLDFYINDTYIDKVLDICKNIKHSDYYVLMALAWLISICYIKYPKKTIMLLESPYLDDFTHNKAIQKIIESKRVNIEEKKRLSGMKRSKK